MSSLLSRDEQAAKKFTRILKNKIGDRNSASKERKNATEEGPRREGGTFSKIGIGKGGIIFI